MSTPLLLASIAGLLLLEAFFALSEIALISASRERLRARAEAGSGTAAAALALLSAPERLLATTLIATNICLVASSFAANEAAARALGPDRSAWAIVILAPFILLFAEILPKMAARRFADSLAPAVAIPTRAAMLLLSPAVAVAGAASRALVGTLRRPGQKHPYVTKEEVRAIVQAERRASLDPDEARLISRLLGMAGATVREIMTPLPDVVSLPAGAGADDAKAAIRRHGYSRLPIWQDRTDNIVGVLHAMDLILAPRAAADLGPLVRRPHYVPEAARIEQVLDEFRRRGHEMAVVVDEHGAAAGIVTLEDLLEELVGEILDEFDRPAHATIAATGEGTWTAEAGLRLGEIEEATGVSLPRGGYETLGGFLAHRLQRIPRAGDRVAFGGLEFTVLEAGERRVRKVGVRREAGGGSAGAG